MMLHYAFLALLVAAPAFHQQVAAVQDFHKTLDAAAAYCEKVKGMALKYVATEDVEVTIYPDAYASSSQTAGGSGFVQPMSGSQMTAMDTAPRMLTPGTGQMSFTFDYQLIQAEGRLEERRTLLEQNGVSKHEPNAQLTDVPFTSKYLIFGPVGFLSKYWQPYFRYQLVGEESLHGRPCVVVRAEPKKTMAENNNKARIWISQDDHSVLRIEWEPESLGVEPSHVVRTSKIRTRTVVCRVDFDVEKNGVRFPSRQVFQEVERGSKKGDETVLREVKYRYSHYKFFTVGVDVKY